MARKAQSVFLLRDDEGNSFMHMRTALSETRGEYEYPVLGKDMSQVWIFDTYDEAAFFRADHTNEVVRGLEIEQYIS